jgi:hypothetical protein
MFVLLLVHRRIKRQVADRAQGYLGAATVRDWRHRVLLSISLWENLDSVYSMGSVPRHVEAARLPSRIGVTTKAGAFSYAGDWRRLMYDVPAPDNSPLHKHHTPRKE